MVVSIAELAGAMRLGDGLTEPPSPLAEELTRLRALGNDEVERYVGGAERKAAIHADVIDQAIIQYAAYLYEKPLASANTGYANAFINSGAASILKPYINRFAVAISDSD